MRIILASSSLVRKQILEKLELKFTTISPDIDESINNNESASELVKRLSLAKAREVANAYPDSLIIGSDQVADLDGKIIGKPANHLDAVSQLKSASGRTLTLYSGVALINSRTGTSKCEVDTYLVEYRNLSDAEIERYLTRVQPYDSCGSLKVEGIGISLLARLNGNDPNTLMGLPVIKLLKLLESEGIVVV
jgi:septum formation protein